MAVDRESSSLSEALPLAASAPTPIRQLTGDPSQANISLMLLLLFLLVLLGLIMYDKRNGYRWITLLRHWIGECFNRMRSLRKRPKQQQRIAPDEALQPQKAVSVDHERTFIDAEISSVLQEALCPSEHEPASQLELESHEREINLKNVFQLRENKHKKGKKSKSKLKSRLQSFSESQGEERKEIQEEDSFEMSQERTEAE